MRLILKPTKYESNKCFKHLRMFKSYTENHTTDDHDLTPASRVGWFPFLLSSVLTHFLLLAGILLFYFRGGRKILHSRLSWKTTVCPLPPKQNPTFYTLGTTYKFSLGFYNVSLHIHCAWSYSNPFCIFENLLPYILMYVCNQTSPLLPSHV